MGGILPDVGFAEPVPLSGCLDEKLRGKLGPGIKQFNPDDTTMCVVIEDNIRSYLGAVEDFLLGQTNVGRIVFGPVFYRRRHEGFRAFLSKNIVRTRISCSVSMQATRSGDVAAPSSRLSAPS